MSHLQAIYHDYSACCDEFSTGIEYLKQRSVEQAALCFHSACTSVSESHCYHSVYLSYCGFAKILTGDYQAIELCRAAADKKVNNSDIYYVLARAEMFCNNRQASIKALSQGLAMDNRHQGLSLMKKQIGYRRFKPIPFFPRHSFVNNSIGKLLRKNK